jgi:hypothetical protein
MKILFFLILIANLALFLWEYRAGAFTQPETVVMEGEPIFLVGEDKRPVKARNE